MVVRLKRLFNGLASIRDYKLEKILLWGEDLIFICNGEKMTIKNADLTSKKFQIIPTAFESKYGSAPYKLIDFRWIPDEGKNDKISARETEGQDKEEPKTGTQDSQDLFR